MSQSNQDVKHYDVAVIGAGAGAKISTPSSKLGLKVALCEKNRLGGTCLNRGCIPSKMLIHPADVACQTMEADLYDINAEIKSVDWNKLVTRVAKEIDEESFSINPNIEANPNIDWYKDAVKFVGKKLLKSGDTVFTADKIFIAAGARPAIPAIPGLKDTPFMTSEEALRCYEQPKDMVVIGGGYISTELAHFYSALGTKVHMFVRSKFLSHEDSEVREEFTRMFKRHPNITVYMKSKMESVHYDKDRKQFSTSFKRDGSEEVETIRTDQCMVVTGVTPNSDTLDLEKSGIETKKGGFVKVDPYLRTTCDGVWAYGDIAGNYLFRHSANFEGEYLMETVIRKDESEGPYPIDYTGMPHAVFSYPQVAGVGATEDELMEKGVEYVKGVNKYQWSAMGMALRSSEIGGIVKLLICKKTRRILGCHIVGEQASVLVHQVIPLMRLNGKLEDLLYMVTVHPALSELVRNAARRARNALVEAGVAIPFRLRLK